VIFPISKSESERELLKDQLHHAQKLDSIGQRLAALPEFNNILAAILGYAGI
jgi:hypothetical protein